MTTTAAVLQDMLTEDTGQSMGDSGGYPKYDDAGKYVGSSSGYGRCHERNKGRDFENEPETVLEFSYHSPDSWDFSVTHNVYHWLKSKVEYCQALDKHFRDFANTEEQKDEYWAENYTAWLEALNKLKGTEVTEAYGPSGTNTYNHDCLLSQTLQFEIIHIESEELGVDGDFLWLQVHGGCDVRGGYTSPRLFQLDMHDECAMFRYGDATITPDLNTATTPEFNQDQPPLQGMPDTRVEHDSLYWDCGDGYAFCCDQDGVKDLREYEATDDPELRGKGVVYIDEEERGHCPITGGLLSAHTY